MSMEAYENLRFESEVYSKLAEAEREAEMTDERFSLEGRFSRYAKSREM